MEAAMDRKIGPYDVKAEAHLRSEGGFEAFWLATWMSQGERMTESQTRGVFATDEDAKKFANAAVEEWCRANPNPPS
jgi:hypothetical protein